MSDQAPAEEGGGSGTTSRELSILDIPGIEYEVVEDGNMQQVKTNCKIRSDHP